MNVRLKYIAAIACFIVAIAFWACTPEREVYLPVLKDAPNFTLTNQDDLEIKLSDYWDKVVVMDFIYTSCPDVCGEMNSHMKSVWEKLDSDLRQDLVLISISFDQEFDTIAILKQYAAIYNVPGWQFLTGTEEQIIQVTDDYDIFYERAGGNHGDLQDHEHVDGRSFNHTSALVIIDQEGKIRKTYADPDLPDNQVTRELEYLLKQ